MMTGMRSGSVMSARFPFGLALLREGQGAFARVLAAHQRGALACVVLPERRVCGAAALVDAERDALRRLPRQRGVGRALFGPRDRGRHQIGEREDIVAQPELGSARGGGRVAGLNVVPPPLALRVV